MTTLAKSNHFTPDLTVLRRIFMTPIALFLALFVGLAGLQVSTATTAEAGLLKKVKVGAKFAGKGFRKMEKAGRKLSRKKGVVGKLGKGMQKAGRGGRKGAKGLRKGIGKGQRAVARQMGKSKVGRGALKAGRAYKKFRKNSLNKAYRRCNAKWCNDAKDATDAVVPG